MLDLANGQVQHFFWSLPKMLVKYQHFVANDKKYAGSDQMVRAGIFFGFFQKVWTFTNISQLLTKENAGLDLLVRAGIFLITHRMSGKSPTNCWC